jgi:predicted nucleic acid-binding protein
VRAVSAGSGRIISDAERAILLTNISRSDLASSFIEKTCIVGFFAMRLYSPEVSIDEYIEVCKEKMASAIVDSLEEAMKRCRERLEHTPQLRTYYSQ